MNRSTGYIYKVVGELVNGSFFYLYIWSSHFSYKNKVLNAVKMTCYMIPYLKTLNQNKTSTKHCIYRNYYTYATKMSWGWHFYCKFYFVPILWNKCVMGWWTTQAKCLFFKTRTTTADTKIHLIYNDIEVGYKTQCWQCLNNIHQHL